MGKPNDTQDQAIWDAISNEHDKLCVMYNEKISLEKRQQLVLNNYTEKISKQETKVKQLCEDKVRCYANSDNKLILDLTDKGMS